MGTRSDGPHVRKTRHGKPSYSSHPQMNSEALGEIRLRDGGERAAGLGRGRRNDRCGELPRGVARRPRQTVARQQGQRPRIGGRKIRVSSAASPSREQDREQCAGGNAGNDGTARQGLLDLKAREKTVTTPLLAVRR